MDTGKVMRQYVGHPLLVGASAGVLTMALVGNQGGVMIGSTLVSPAMAIGISCAAADVVGQVAGNYLKTLPQSNKLAESEKKLLSPGLTGMATLATVQMFIGKPYGFTSYIKVFALGATSEIAGSYVAGMISPLM
jgi:hypothetical protein